MKKSLILNGFLVLVLVFSFFLFFFFPDITRPFRLRVGPSCQHIKKRLDHPLIGNRREPPYDHKGKILPSATNQHTPKCSLNAFISLPFCYALRMMMNHYTGWMRDRNDT